MKYPQPLARLLLPVMLFITAGAFSVELLAGQVRIAVTSNFDFTAEELKSIFETQTGHSVTLLPGPSNRHYGEIVRGTDYDIFLADDVQRPEVLERNEKIIPGSRFTYARGRLVLWSLDSRPLTPQVLQEKDFNLLAVTNPLLDPYGRAAQEFLQKMELWDELQEKIVQGENIGQTYQFAIGGDVDMALIALSQIIYGRYMQAGSYWPIPDDYYAPIEQQGVLLTDNPTALEFFRFMQSPQGQQIIRSNGFLVP